MLERCALIKTDHELLTKIEMRMLVLKSQATQPIILVAKRSAGRPLLVLADFHSTLPAPEPLIELACVNYIQDSTRPA